MSKPTSAKDQLLMPLVDAAEMISKHIARAASYGIHGTYELETLLFAQKCIHDAWVKISGDEEFLLMSPIEEEEK